MGGGRISPSLTGDLRLYTLLKSVCRAAIFMCLFMLPVACQQACLIPDEEAEVSSRGKDMTEEPKDSTEVKPEVDVNGWEGTIDANFEFGGTPQEGGEE